MMIKILQAKLQQYVNRELPDVQTGFTEDRGGLPWWLSGKESASQCRGHKFNPRPEKIPHATEQLSPRTTTTEPRVLKLTCPRACALQQEKPPQGEA